MLQTSAIGSFYKPVVSFFAQFTGPIMKEKETCIMTRKYITYEKRKEQQTWNKIERTIFEISMAMLALVIGGMLGWAGATIVHMIQSLF